MKRLVKFMLFLSLLLAFACGEKKEKPVDIDLTEKPTDYITAKTLGDVSEYNPNLTQDFAEVLSHEKQIIENAPVSHINKLAFDMYDHLKEGENITYSPMSISLALAMAYAGAEGRTKDEMKNVLQFGENNQAFHDSFGRFATLLAHKDRKESGTELNISNASWLQKDFSIAAKFQETLKSAYGVKAVGLDFKNDPQLSTDIMNKVISEHTKGKIDQLFKTPVDNATKLILTNAVYFNGKWKNEFYEEATREDTFTTNKNEEIRIHYMNQQETFNYFEDEEKQILAAPYEDGEFEMVFVLPRATKTSYLHRKFTTENFHAQLDSLKPRLAKVQLPKFSQKLSPNVKDILFHLGIKKAFDQDKADFSGISETEKLYISGIVHEALVEISEKGTTAAAASAIVLAPGSAAPGFEEPIVPVEFYATRPFMFYLVHKQTKAILFMGRFDRP